MRVGYEIVMTAAQVAEAAHELSTWHGFVWGAFGALISLLAIEGLPLSRKLATGELDWRPEPLRCMGVLAFVLFFVALGGSVAILVGGATEAKHAIFYGIGWQGTLSGYMRATRGVSDPS